jgi:hypothetical protein
MQQSAGIVNDECFGKEPLWEMLLEVGWSIGRISLGDVFSGERLPHPTLWIATWIKK